MPSAPSVLLWTAPPTPTSGRFLNQGQLPTADAVRIEELINYFNYNDPDPKA